MGTEISARQRGEVIRFGGAREKQRQGRAESKIASFERFSVETRNLTIGNGDGKAWYPLSLCIRHQNYNLIDSLYITVKVFM